MPHQNDENVARRAVFFIGGYDPKSPEAFFDRFRREKARYEALVDATVESGTLRMASDDLAIMPFDTTVGDAQVHTDFHFLTVDGLVLRDFERPFLVRLWRYLVTFADYTVTLTAFRFVRHAWRFSLYFLYPFVVFLLTLLVSLGVAGLIWTSGVSLSFLMAPLVFLATFSAFVQLGWKHWHVLHLMDLWSFSREFLRRSRPGADKALDQIADAIAAADESDDYDEIVAIGHSTGGALIAVALDRAAARREGFGKGRAAVTLLTVGSTALKIGLHPAGQWFRDVTRRLVENPAIGWAEYQCVNDIINFYRTNPARLMGAGDGDKPVVRSIRVRNMVDPQFYRDHIRGNFFRLHYQFVFGNSRPYHYDFPAICLGPVPMAERMKRGPAEPLA